MSPNSIFNSKGTHQIIQDSCVSIRKNLLFLQSVQADSADQNLYHVQACGSFKYWGVHACGVEMFHRDLVLRDVVADHTKQSYVVLDKLCSCNPVFLQQQNQ